MATRTITDVPEPGTLVRFYPERHPGGPPIYYWPLFGKGVPMQGVRIFEVSGYVFNEDGGQLTVKQVLHGTHHVPLPYPHEMFELVGDAEAARIKERWRAEREARWARYRNGGWLMKAFWELLPRFSPIGWG